MGDLNFHIVIPAHNESKHIETTLKSLTQQTLKPKQIIVVDDNSTDNTFQIAQQFQSEYDYVQVVKNSSSQLHEPGAKVINAFYQGFALVPQNYDVICKFDADLIFPEHYLKELSLMFQDNPRLGMAGGILHIRREGNWQYEAIANKTHLRGPIKAYRKDCFIAINGLRNSIGWDTADVLLAAYNKWIVKTNEQLIVKHLKPTGSGYSNKSFQRQGKTFYKLRYGFTLALIASAKVALQRKNLIVFYEYVKGYIKAQINKDAPLVTKAEGRFIRKLRWQGIKEKLKI